MGAVLQRLLKLLLTFPSTQQFTAAAWKHSFPLYFKGNLRNRFVVSKIYIARVQSLSVTNTYLPVGRES